MARPRGRPPLRRGERRGHGPRERPRGRRHQGAWLPFEVVLPESLLEEDNLLEVECFLPDAHHGENGDDFAEMPHGKMSWYGPQGGIWQSVSSWPATPTTSARPPRPPLARGRLEMRLGLSRPHDGMVALEIAAPDGETVHTETLHASGDALAHAVTLPDVQPWSPDTPALYTFAPRCAGPRATSTPDRDLRLPQLRGARRPSLLNGQPFYMRGALDQDYYPDGFDTPPSLELLEDQVRKAKAMGLNLLRCHIKVPDPRYYEVADRLGILIWTEIPNVETFSPASEPRLRATCRASSTATATTPPSSSGRS
jgi:hypothetical protein